MSNMDADDLLLQYKGHIVPQTYNAGWIALSFVVSLVGAGSTLELINRRTGLHGLFNNILLMSSAVTMGGVSIWCMHFIGNRAITLADGQMQLQIAYSPGMTTLSFFVPIAVLLTAFVAIGSSNRVSWLRLIPGGVLVGFAVCGMHYLGNASIQNYVCSYTLSNIIAAAVIAVAASTVALATFFQWRSIWASSWWKRLSSAVILAGAVSGMHWVAAVGTRYRLVKIHDKGPSRDATVIVVICLSVSACLVIAGSAALKTRAVRKSATRAQKITLGAAVFDRHGRILVDTDGVAPSAVITDSFLEKHSGQGFDTAHGLFQWMFQASHNWESVANLLAGMKAHLAERLHAHRKSHHNFGIDFLNNNDDIADDYDLVFREQYCAAAQALCERMSQPLSSAGQLWNEMLPTGDTGERSRNHLMSRASSQNLAEKASSMSSVELYGRGSLLFLVRQVDNDRDAAKLTSAGYRFAEIHQVSAILRSRMQIQSPDIADKLRQMASYAEDQTKPRGVYLSFFGVRARVNSSGFDVLVHRPSRRFQPMASMSLERLEDTHRDFLKSLAGLTVHAAVQELEKTREDQDGDFVSKLTTSIVELRDLVQEPLFDHAVLSPKTIEAPTSAGGDDATMAELITFTLVIPIHAAISGKTCDFTPYSFFKTQQACLVDQLPFSRGMHYEFGPLGQRALNASSVEVDKKTYFGRWDRKSLHSRSSAGGSSASRPKSASKSAASSSTDELVTEPSNTLSQSDSTTKMGGILVSQEITVGIEPAVIVQDGVRIMPEEGDGGRQTLAKRNTIEMRDLGTSAAVVPGHRVQALWVDVLFARCIEGR